MARYEPLMWPALLAFTLGLAPFTPEPHLVEKIRWIATGQSMAPIDWFDVVMHGAPWAWLGVAAIRVLRPPQGPAPEE